MNRIYKVTLKQDKRDKYKTIHEGIELDTLTILEHFDKSDIFFEIVHGERWVSIEDSGIFIRLKELENY